MSTKWLQFSHSAQHWSFVKSSLVKEIQNPLNHSRSDDCSVLSVLLWTQSFPQSYRTVTELSAWFFIFLVERRIHKNRKETQNWPTRWKRKQHKITHPTYRSHNSQPHTRTWLYKILASSCTKTFRVLRTFRVMRIICGKRYLRTPNLNLWCRAK